MEYLFALDSDGAAHRYYSNVSETDFRCQLSIVSRHLNKVDNITMPLTLQHFETKAKNLRIMILEVVENKLVYGQVPDYIDASHVMLFINKWWTD